MGMKLGEMNIITASNAIRKPKPLRQEGKRVFNSFFGTILAIVFLISIGVIGYVFWQVIKEWL